MTITKSLTVEEFERMSLPHSQFELIEGELVEMSPAGRRATRTAGRLGARLTIHVESRGLGEVTSADGGFVLFPGRKIVRVPDVAFVRADRLVELDEDGFYRLAPDFAVEVISPTDRLVDVLAKVAMYLEAGVRLVWLVDPRAQTVAVHRPDGTVTTLVAGDELDGGEVLPEFRVAVAEVFG